MIMVWVMQVMSFLGAGAVLAAELMVGDPAPLFSTQTHDGQLFDLTHRRGSWTVLYFYPRAETPGCTRQACSFRDLRGEFEKRKIGIFGVSTDSVEAQAKFHRKENLNFTLLADPGKKVVAQYGTQMPILGISKRWTFVIDPNLRIRWVDRDVDPVLDARKVIQKIDELLKNSAYAPLEH